FPVRVLPARFPADAGPGGLAAALRELFDAAAEAARDAAVIALSDRGVDARWVPIPMLLAVAAVHHELIRRGLRMRTSLIAETGGLDRRLVTQYFPGTPSRLDGIGLTELAAEALDRHRAALSTPHEALTEAGLVRFRRDGEYHAFNPYVVKAMHRAIRTGDAVAREALIGLIASRPPATVRDLLEFVPQA